MLIVILQVWFALSASALMVFSLVVAAQAGAHVILQATSSVASWRRAGHASPTPAGHLR